MKTYVNNKNSLEYYFIHSKSHKIGLIIYIEGFFL